MDLNQTQNFEYAQLMVVTCQHGIHLRVAAEISVIANQFTSNIHFIVKSLEVDAKSLLALLELGAAKGEKIKVSASGPDSEAAVTAVAQFFEREARLCDQQNKERGTYPQINP